MARVYESNGPDVKIRGNPSHIAEKYIQLARDAQTSGDPVAAENYYQHAEHYFRLIAAAQEQFRQSNPHAAYGPTATSATTHATTARRRFRGRRRRRPADDGQRRRAVRHARAAAVSAARRATLSATAAAAAATAAAASAAPPRPRMQPKAPATSIGCPRSSPAASRSSPSEPQPERPRQRARRPARPLPAASPAPPHRGGRATTCRAASATTGRTIDGPRTATPSLRLGRLLHAAPPGEAPAPA